MKRFDIEVGCQIWSESRQDSRGQVGGVVVAITVDGNGERCFKVVEALGRDLRITDIVESDVRPGTTTHYTRNTAIAAQQIHRHLLKASPKADRQWRAQLAVWAGTLELIAAGGSLTPLAEQRFQDAQAAKRAEWDRHD